MKRIIFFLIIFLPAIIFLSLFLSIFDNVARIKKVDYNKIHACLEDYLKKDKGQASIIEKDGAIDIRYHYFLKDASYKPSGKTVRFRKKATGPLIYFFGSSEFAFKPYDYKGDFPFVFQVLEEELTRLKDNNLQLVNFSMNGLDTFDLKEIINKAVAFKKPEFIIYYDVGASDFEGAYFSCIKNNFKVISPFLKNLSKLMIFKSPPKIGKANEVADWFMRSYVDPNALRLLQRAHIIKIPWEPFKGYNQLIMSYYEKNVMSLVKISKENNIPLLIVTGVINLESPTFGIYNMSDAFFDEGMRQKDYFKKVYFLQQAKDTEIFTGELSSKSPIYNFLTSLRGENIYVFDVYEKLKSEKINLGYNLFYDYGHMRPELHKMIADYLFAYIKEKKILK